MKRGIKGPVRILEPEPETPNALKPGSTRESLLTRV